MPYPVATWDEEVLGRPERDLRMSLPSSTLRSDSVNAEPRYLRVAQKRSTTVDVRIRMNRTQWAAFQAFYDQTLGKGLAWFSMYMYSPGGRSLETVHLSGYSVGWIPQDGNERFTYVDMEIERAA